MLSKFLNRFLNSYLVNEVMDYHYPDYKPQYDEVMKVLLDLNDYKNKTNEGNPFPYESLISFIQELINANGSLGW
jgi:hypothetical protein